ncbi:MAG: hypothetical protein V4547_10330 [Bacteroidota bacterium]
MTKILYLRNNTCYNIRQSFAKNNSSLYKIDLFDLVKLITMPIKDWILNYQISNKLSLMRPVICAPSVHIQHKFPRPYSH